MSTYEPHCCVVVYSVVARNSFRVAEEIINYLWRENITKDKSVILVGNKADLARARVITTVGEWCCHYITGYYCVDKGTVKYYNLFIPSACLFRSIAHSCRG